MTKTNFGHQPMYTTTLEHQSPLGWNVYMSRIHRDGKASIQQFVQAKNAPTKIHAYENVKKAWHKKHPGNEGIAVLLFQEAIPVYDEDTVLFILGEPKEKPTPKEQSPDKLRNDTGKPRTTYRKTS